MRKVLIIDNEKINLLTTKLAVESLTPNSIGILAYSASEGIKLAQEKQPDCILLDIVMPEMDGYEALEILKSTAETKNIPVILVSGLKKDTHSRIKALNIGADAFISRPFDHEELTALVKVMFRIKDAEEKLNKQLLDSHLKFDEVVDFQKSAVVIYNVENNGQDFIIADFNSAAERLENVKKEDVIGKNVMITFPGAKEFGIIDVFKEVYKTGEPATSTVTFYKGDKTQGWRENYIYKISSGQIVSVYEDVTKKMLADLALKQSERKYRTIADYNYAWEYWRSPEGKYNYVSPACLETSGHTAEEFIENPELIIDITHPDYKKRLELHYHEEQQKTGSHQFEFKIIKPDGTVRWILHKCRPIFSENNVFLGRRGINKDVTKYKKAIESVNRLNKAIESSKDVVFMTDTNKVFTYINPQFTRLYGYTKEEVVGKNTPKILDSGTLSQEEHGELFEKLLQKESIYVEYVNKCKNGKLIDIEASADPVLNDEGKIIGFLAMQRDNADRKRSEKIQKIILNISNEANKQLDIKALFDFVKNEANSIIDTTNIFVGLYDEETNLISLTFNSGKERHIKSFPPGKTFAGWVIKNEQPLLATPKKQKELIENDELEIIGIPAAVWLGVPLKVDGKTKGVFAVQNYEDEHAYNPEDIDFMEIISNQISYPVERIRKEQQLTQALDRATESDRLKSAFLATMSHELRTPLNAVIGFSDLVDEETSMEDVLMFCKRIFNSGHHLLTLLDDMFELSFIESGKIKLNTSRTELKATLKTIYEILNIEKINLAKQDIIFKVNLKDENIPLWIYTDEGKLKQILINLLKNALKYTDVGKVEFGYEKIIDDKKTMLKFYVKDTGIGIPEDKKDIVFDEFRQIDDSHTRKHDGIGVGLAISKKIVRFMRGDIWFDSVPGKGTTFYFTIPYEKG